MKHETEKRRYYEIKESISDHNFRLSSAFRSQTKQSFKIKQSPKKDEFTHLFAQKISSKMITFTEDLTAENQSSIGHCEHNSPCSILSLSDEN